MASDNMLINPLKKWRNEPQEICLRALVCADQDCSVKLAIKQIVEQSGLSEEEAVQSLEGLVSLGFVAKSEDGMYEITEDGIRVYEILESNHGKLDHPDENFHKHLN
jgi:predicted transcriptional regulator